ncbi:MAG: immune inhibitor A domain-containing protein [bacterium]
MRKIQHLAHTAALFFLMSVLVMAAESPALAGKRGGGGARSCMPPNEASILPALRARATVSQGVSTVDIHKTYMDYLKQKVGKEPEDRPHPLGSGYIASTEETDQIENHHGQKGANGQRIDHILVLLVEFAGAGIDDLHTGPLHNGISEPDRRYNSRDFWIADFNREHYEKMLFDTTEGALSMSNYYLEQSGGTYTVDGRAYGWIKVNHAEWYYGADDPEGGIDNLNGPVWNLVRDAIEAAGDSIPWQDYDMEDPYDMDDDGVYDEPDGYVDHIMIIHAGVGQESGGGHQGDDAIWSHSGWADWGFEHGPGFGGIPTANPSVWVGAYTTEPEDGTIGVFCHEFAHDLGLPDEYDTIYSGDPSTGFWSLMSSGGWLCLPGQAAGTCPASLSVWGKYVLGWVEPVTVNPGDEKNCLLLRSVEQRGLADKCIKINLPDSVSTVKVNKPHSGEYEWYSGRGDSLRNTLTRTFNLPPGPGTLLKFWTWYDIEADFDYGCVEVSSDGGQKWQKIQGNITTSDDPHNQNPGNGITGKSKGWVQAEFDLSQYQGQVLLRFKYLTDVNVQGLGWAIDDLEIITRFGNLLFSDTMESGAGEWEARGWYIFSGSEETRILHYYLAEWRQPVGFDASMTNWYHVVDSVPPNNIVETFSANPGMLLWYRDGEFDDNWVGMHPWKGFLLIVDSHPELILADDTAWLANWLFDPAPPSYDPPYPNMDLPFCTRLQITDATFGLNPTLQSSLTRWFGLPVSAQIPQLPPVSVFDDSKSYVDTSWSAWFESRPFGVYIRNTINSVDTPACGLRVIVEEEETVSMEKENGEGNNREDENGKQENHDGGAARVSVDFTRFTP